MHSCDGHFTKINVTPAHLISGESLFGHTVRLLRSCYSTDTYSKELHNKQTDISQCHIL